MNTRREFLGTTAGALAGIAFVGCDLLAAAPARAQARRREVMVGGRRVKTVDVHAHCAVPEAMALMGMTLSTPGSTLPPLLHMATQASERIRAMDEQGIDVEALSINPYWYKADRDVASQLIKLQNEKLAEACAAHPDRSPPSNLRRASRSTGCAGPASGAASTARRSATPSSTRSGRRPSSSACSSSFTRRARGSPWICRTGSRATACSTT
jgi:hypothetical protein